jgi:hypothetical protein
LHQLKQSCKKSSARYEKHSSRTGWKRIILDPLLHILTVSTSFWAFTKLRVEQCEDVNYPNLDISVRHQLNILAHLAEFLADESQK